MLYYVHQIEKETKMSQATTPSLQDQLSEARASLRFFKGHVQFLAAQLKEQKLDAKIAKAAARRTKEESAAAKREAAIAKAQARLEKLLAKQVGAVGAKAVKANKRPSKAVTFGAEDNAIAAAIMARKATA
jgi:hypothetical protein